LRLNFLVLSLSACLAHEVAAQASTQATVPLTAGSRVRVKTPTLVAPLVANFLEQRADTLVFIEDGGGGRLVFALSQIERLETTAGEAGRNKRPIGRGAAIGGGIGLVGGLLFAAAAQPSDSTKEYSRPLTAALGAGVGAGIGAILGSRVKSERWVNVPLPRQFSLIPNRRGGFTIAIGIR
jgi:hypothetical protein